MSMKRTISDRPKVGGDGPPKKRARKGKEPAREANERAQWPEYFESVCVSFLTIHDMTLKPNVALQGEVAHGDTINLPTQPSLQVFKVSP